VRGTCLPRSRVTNAIQDGVASVTINYPAEPPNGFTHKIAPAYTGRSKSSATSLSLPSTERHSCHKQWDPGLSRPERLGRQNDQPLDSPHTGLPAFATSSTREFGANPNGHDAVSTMRRWL
jgi:hypothetical protein